MGRGAPDEFYMTLKMEHVKNYAPEQTHMREVSMIDDNTILGDVYGTQYNVAGNGSGWYLVRIGKNYTIAIFSTMEYRWLKTLL